MKLCFHFFSLLTLNLFLLADCQAWPRNKDTVVYYKQMQQPYQAMVTPDYVETIAILFLIVSSTFGSNNGFKNYTFFTRAIHLIIDHTRIDSFYFSSKK